MRLRGVAITSCCAIADNLIVSTERPHYRAPAVSATGPTYRWLADSKRWEGFDFRPGDIVISAPAKSGTTWTQMICALLVFGTPDLPAPLTTLSPWLDMCLLPLAQVREQLDAQSHRRFIKTHTPLDGLPQDDRVTYIAVARDPRDIPASLRHHRANVVRRVLDDLPSQGPSHQSAQPHATDLDVHEAFRRWVNEDAPPHDQPYTLRGVVWHQSRAWSRRDDPNVVLLHYGDLLRDLDREMRRLADRLGITVATDAWPDLVAAATFDRMRERSDQLVPDERRGVFADPAKFFRAGTSGGWRDVLTDHDLARYRQRLSELAPPELIHWLHNGGS
jgi:aryl sulfotransferase